MKRHILLLTLMCSCLLSCVMEKEQTPTRENYSLSQYASNATEISIMFPLAMMETAFNIEAYENATAEEKVEMTYIFNTLIKQGNSYQMKNFHSFYMTPDGKPSHEPGAEWKISTFDYGSGSDYTLKCTDEGKWEMTVKNDNGEVDFDITKEADDESLFNWTISFSGSLTSSQGRIVEIRSAGPITRKVLNENERCYSIMTGKIEFDIYENKDASTPLDTFTYSFSGRKETNTFYQL